MKINADEWNKETGKLYNYEVRYNGHTIANELVRYEGILYRALALQPEVNNSSLGDFKQLFHSLFSPTNGEEKKDHNFLSYFHDYRTKLKDKGQSNYKAYNTCYNYVGEYTKSTTLPFSSVDMRFYDGFTQFLIKKNLAANTIANQWKLIKAVMQSAFIKGYHTNEQVYD